MHSMNSTNSVSPTRLVGVKDSCIMQLTRVVGKLARFYEDSYEPYWGRVCGCFGCGALWVAVVGGVFCI